MTDEQHSAEKDLLRLIENPGDIKPKEEPAPAKKGFFRKKAASGAEKKDGKKGFDLRTLVDRRIILRLLFLVTVVVFVVLVVTVFREYSRLKNTKNLVKFTYIAQGKEAGAPEADAAGEKMPGAIAIIRNIFKPGPAKKESEPQGDETVMTLADYRLVGLSQENDPKDSYTMIKNNKTNITFFLKTGETLDGMEVGEILENKVILKVKGRDIELK